MHLVRNAVDHGVEEGPEARRAAGKPAVARVEVRLVARRGGARIEVVDDGRGLDVGRIRQVAEERGLATPDEALAAKDVERLVLTPGFTTAREATLHSGRGVGLDVALRRVEAMGGRLSIWSRPGRGVRIRMDLPLDQGGRGRG
jgi:chemotaxis protein histidine kinase CheA